jgi:tetratricopeptide (TPR) repeat protein
MSHSNQNLLQAIEQRLDALETKLPAQIDQALYRDLRNALSTADVDRPFVAAKTRFVLETILKDVYHRQFPDKRVPLLGKIIDELHQAAVLPLSLARDADYIRLKANDAAHGGSTEHNPLSAWEAEHLILITLNFVEWYILIALNFVEWYTKVYSTANPVDPATVFAEAPELGPNPYRSLECFRLQDAPLFFGREQDSEELWGFRQQAFISITGTSGSGKSSLAFAGLAARLQQQGWIVLSCRPANQPFYELAKTLAAALYPDASTDYSEQVAFFTQALRSQDLDLNALLEQIRGDRPGLLLLIDQFEELFTQADAPQDLHNYCASLAKAVHASQGTTLYTITLRADFLGLALQEAALADLLDHYPKKILGAIADLRPLIEQPAKATGVVFESLLVERLLRDVQQGEPRSNESPTSLLPLLQFTLARLWDAQEDSKITHRAYGKLEGVQQALAHHAESVYRQLSAAEQASMQRLLVQWVHRGQGTGDSLPLVYREHLAADDWPLIRRLADERLLVMHSDPRHPQESVAIAHEALLQHWQRLQDWVNENREFQRWQARLQQRLLNWQGSEADSALLSGASLLEAQENTERNPGRLSAAECRYIEASLAHAEQQRAALHQQASQDSLTAKARRSLALALAAGLFAVTVGWQWWQAEQRQQRTEQQRELALQLINRLTFDIPQQLSVIPQARAAIINGTLQNVATLERILALDGDDTNALKRKGDTLDRMANLYAALGNREESRNHYQQAIGSRKRLAEKDADNVEWQADLAASYNNLGSIEYELQHVDAARDGYEHALALFKHLALQNADNAEWKIDLAASYNNLGLLESNLQHFDATRENYAQALAIDKRLVEQSPNNAAWQADLAASYSNLGNLEYDQQHFEAARQSHLQALAIRKQLTLQTPDNAEWQNNLAASYNNLGNLESRLQRFEVARGYYADSLAIRQRLVEQAPNNAEWQNDLAASYNNLGNLDYDMQHFDAARENHAHALAIRKRLIEQAPDNAEWQNNLAASYNNLGNLEYDLQHIDAARQAYEQAVTLYEPLAAHPDAARQLNFVYPRLSDLVKQQHNLEQAGLYLEKAVHLSQRLLAEKSTPPAQIKSTLLQDFSTRMTKLFAQYHDRAKQYQEDGKTERALQDYKNGEHIMEYLVAWESTTYLDNFAAVYAELADLHDKLGHNDLATHYADKGIKTLREAIANRKDNKKQLAALCWRLILRNRVAEAQPECQRAYDLNKNFASAINLAHTYLLQGDALTAQRYYQESVDLAENEPQLKKGPPADFERFLDKGWQVDAVVKARDGMKQAFATKQGGQLKAEPVAHLTQSKPEPVKLDKPVKLVKLDKPAKGNVSKPMKSGVGLLIPPKVVGPKQGGQLKTGKVLHLTQGKSDRPHKPGTALVVLPKAKAASQKQKQGK